MQPGCQISSRCRHRAQHAEFARAVDRELTRARSDGRHTSVNAAPIRVRCVSLPTPTVRAGEPMSRARNSRRPACVREPFVAVGARG